MEKRRTRSDAKKVDETVDQHVHSSPLAKMHPQEFDAYMQYRFHNESFGDFIRRMYGKNRILKEMIPDMPRKRTFLAEEIEMVDDLEALDHVQAPSSPAAIKLEDPEEEEEASHPAQDENDHSFSPPPSPELGDFGDMYNGHQQPASADMNVQIPDAEGHKKKRRRRFPLVGMKRYKKAEPGPSRRRRTGEEKSEPEDPMGARLPPMADLAPADPLPGVGIPVVLPDVAAVPHESKKVRRTFKTKKEPKVEPKHKKSEKTTPKKEHPKAKKTLVLVPAPENLPVQPMNHLIRGLDRLNPNWWIPAMYSKPM